MSHSSKIKDADAFFEVDAITRQIINKTPQKITLIQYDHNSESFTFSLPRHIEGHDMAESTKAEVHFINIETGGANSHADKYEMKDLQPDPTDESKVICTWLISSNATQYAGTLSFMIRFACLDDKDNYVYVWNTATNSEINIANGMDNGAAIVEEYPDILAQWRKNVLADNAYITDFFKKVPEGKTIDDLINSDYSGCYILFDANQFGHTGLLYVCAGIYSDNEAQMDIPCTYQTRYIQETHATGCTTRIETRNDAYGWSEWEDTFGGSNDVGEFRLLTEITADGETMYWTITKDADGRNLNVHEVFMEINHAEESGYQSIWINGKQEFVRQKVSKGYLEPIYISLRGNLLAGIIGRHSAGVNTTNTIFNSKIVDYKSITEIKTGGYGTSVLPVGTTIKIYAR